MLNEEKIILMTKLAIYEKGEGKKEIPMSRYYRNDYVGVHMLYTFLSVTAGYVLLFALYIARDVEDFLSSLTTMDLKKFLFTAVAIYICAELFFLFVAWVIYRHRFKKNRQHLNEYFGDLKKLKKIQKKEQAKAMKMVEGKENEPAGSFEEDAYDDISPFEDEATDGDRDPFEDEDAGEEADSFEDGDEDPFIWDTEDDAEPSGDPFVPDDDTNSLEDRDADPFAWDAEGEAEPSGDRFALEDDVIPVQENGQSMDPEAEVEQALKKIMSGGREDDEEDEDGFTFSS